MPEIGTGKLVATVPKAIQHIWNARRKKRFKLPKIYGKDVSQAALPEGEGGAKDGGDSKTKDELKLERISACKGIGDQDLMHKYVGSLSSARFQKASASGTPESLFDIKGGSRGKPANGAIRKSRSRSGCYVHPPPRHLSDSSVSIARLHVM